MSVGAPVGKNDFGAGTAPDAPTLRESDNCDSAVSKNECGYKQSVTDSEGGRHAHSPP